MAEEEQFVRKNAEPEISYFGLQAYTGTTKHMGGLETTKELIELCHINGDSYVLDVGCGAGATACYLAKAHGCSVVGVDIRESMIAVAQARAQGERLEDRVEFRGADARDLPFEDGVFDAVLCESVATFVEDKQRVADELARVTRPGGYVGLNEEVWLKTPPPRLVQEVKRVFSVEPDVPTADDWLQMLKEAGLRDVVAKPYEFDARRESSQLRRYRIRDILRMFYRTFTLYLKSDAFRGYMKDRRRPPADVFKYFGYALLVGRR
jgi:SAM-dependent methyltransferase